MAASYKERCIVLKKTKLGEADLILTMLAQGGTQVKGVAKGARKPGNKRFGARLEPFSVVDLQLYPGRSLDTITEVRCVQSNSACREDLDRSSACSVIAELAAKVIADGEVDERVFPMMQAAFAQIGESDPSKAPVIAIAFAIKFVAMMGLRPALHECALCGDPVEYVQCFDIEHGGVVCPSCLSTLPSCPGSTFCSAPRLHSWYRWTACLCCHFSTLPTAGSPSTSASASRPRASCVCR